MKSNRPRVIPPPPETTGLPPGAEEPPVQPDVNMDSVEDYAIKADLVKIETVLQELNESGGKIRISRRGPSEQKFSYIIQLGIAEFDLETIKKQFGGGDYKAQTFRSNGQLYKTFDFSIDPRLKGSLDESVVAMKAGQGSATEEASKVLNLARQLQVPQGGMNMEVMLKMMEMGQQRSSETMMLIMTMMSKSQESMAQMMTAMMTGMAALGANKTDTTAQIMPVLIEMIRANGNQPSQAANMAEVLELVKAAKDLHGSDKDEPLWERIMKHVAPILGPVGAAVIGSKMTGQPFPTVPVPGQPAQALPLAPGEVPVEVPVGQPVDYGSLIRTLILNGAQKDSDPEVYAIVITDMLNPEQLAGVHAILTRDDWRALIFVDDANALQFSETKLDWFEELREAFVDQYEQLTSNSASRDPSTTVPDSGGQVGGNRDTSGAGADSGPPSQSSGTA